MKKIITFFAVVFSIALQAQYLQQANSFGSTSSESGLDLATDPFGNVIAAGYFSGTVDFDPGPGITLLNANTLSVYVTKSDYAGHLIWAKQVSGTLAIVGTTVAVDPTGNIIVGGYVYGTADFDPGAGVVSLTSAGSTDAFVVKLDANGNYMWADLFGGLSSEVTNSVTTDLSGVVYATGYFQGPADFDPTAGVNNITGGGGYDFFVVGISPAGTVNFANGLGSGGFESGTGIACDVSGNVYVCGNFEYNVDFDLGSGVTTLSANGSWDMFIEKIDPAGNLIWAKSFGGPAQDQIFDIALDVSANIYATGYFDMFTDFDPSASVANLSTLGGWDSYVLKWNSSGAYVWVKDIGGAGAAEHGTAVEIDNTGNVYTIGRFDGTADFNPGAGTEALTSAGSLDVFVQKMNASGVYQWARSFGGTAFDEGKSITTNANGDVFIGGNFSGTADFDPTAGTFNLTAIGGDDIFFTILGCQNASAIAVGQCSSYTWPSTGQTYTASGTYSDTLTNMFSCDSIVTLSLTIFNATTAIDSVTACHSYTSPSGNYVWTTTGVYYDTLQNSAGCDSLITLVVDILPTADTSVTQTSVLLYSNATNATYQWIDCSTGNPIAGAINPAYVAPANGSYAVIVTQNSCPDTSSCYAVTDVSVQETPGSFMSIVPNPTEGNFAITTGKLIAAVSVFDVTGQQVYRLENINGQNCTIDLNQFANGAYSIQTEMQDGSFARAILMKK